MEEIFTVYWGPGGRLLGAFPNQQEAETFVSNLTSDPYCGPQAEFEISSLPFRPRAADVDL